MDNQKLRKIIEHVKPSKPIVLRLNADSVKTHFASNMARWKTEIVLGKQNEVKMYYEGTMFFSNQN